MAKQRAPIEVNSLSGGLITEANALTFPDSASLDESNFELGTDGSRSRRLGIAFEDSAEQLDLNVSYTAGAPTAVTSFLWENVSGSTRLSYAVVQADNKLHFYSTEGESLSPRYLGEYVVEAVPSGNKFGFANIDGALVVVTGGRDIITVVANTDIPQAPVFSGSTSNLTIRDLFGTSVEYDRSVEDGGSSERDPINLANPEYITKRPLPEGLPTGGSAPGTAYYTTTGLDEFGYGWPGGSIQYITAGFNNNYTVTPNTYEGYLIEGYGVRKHNAAEFNIFMSFSGSTGRPSFESMTIHDEISGRDYTLARSGYNGNEYLVTIPASTFSLWLEHYPAGASFSVEGDVVGASAYNYNLRNQSFATKRMPKTGTAPSDPITQFTSVEPDGRLPSMADTVTSALYNNLDEANKTVDRFHAADLLDNSPGSYPAPKGYFIIDALARSESRVTRWGELLEDQGISNVEFGPMPLDETPGGPRAIAEYGGRLWYGGFSENGTESVAGATRLESYLLYSQMANSKNVLTRCYQSGDPTSLDAPELLETDGGFLSLDGAYGVHSLTPLGNSLLVFSENGVWAVSGSDGNYFTPTAPRVQKITDKGSVSHATVVAIDTSIVYWSRDGIYAITLASANGYEVQSLTEKTIQTLYNEIGFVDKLSAIGSYDPYESTVTWVYHNTIDRLEKTSLLRLKMTSGAFTKFVIEDGLTGRTLLGFASVPPFTSTIGNDIVTVGSSVVLAGEDRVVMEGAFSADPRYSTSKGIVVSDVGGASNLSFAGFTGADFKDWGEVDAPAYMVTGYVSGGDFQRYKQMPYITFHFDRTEDGFEADVNGDWYPTNVSGCLVQAQWDWANSVDSGRWSRAFQAYRYKTQFMPANVGSTYDSGFSTVVTKNKIRGKGRVLSLKIATEEGKDCRLLGWSAIMGVNSNV